MKIRIEEKNYIYESKKIVNIKFYIKRMLRFILANFIDLASWIIKPKRKDDAKYYVSICAMFRDEDKYLKEWIEFHRIVGIEHFYLYNNCSNDGYAEVLKPYIENGIVTIIDWPYEKGQMKAYRDCISKYSKDNNWLGFIDLDEFVVPNKMDDIKLFLEQYRKYASVVLYWRYFGSSGIMDRDENKLVIEDFIVCWPKYANVGKCFYNTDFDFDIEYHDKYNPYFHHLLWGKYGPMHFPPVNVFHKQVIFGNHCIPSSELPIQINHYLLKSYKEYMNRKSKKGGGTHGVEMHDLDYFYSHEKLCQGVDYHAYKYIIKLKLAMSGDDNNAYND